MAERNPSCGTLGRLDKIRRSDAFLRAFLCQPSSWRRSAAWLRHPVSGWIRPWRFAGFAGLYRISHLRGPELKTQGEIHVAPHRMFPDVLPEDTALVLPPCPAVLAGLFEAVQRDHDLREVSSLIAADPAICGSVLRTANSVAEAGHTSPARPLQAVTKLGVRRVLGIACAIAAPGAFPLPPQWPERFWRLSRTTAEAARQVARRIPGPAEEDAYLYGLFRDCGIPLLMLNYPDYEQTVQDAIAENMPSTKLEYFRYGTHHAMVGGNHPPLENAG